MDGTATIFQAQPTFRSPTHILVPKLAHSRDRWKAKAAQRRQQLKLAKLTIRDLQRSREMWREQCSQRDEQLSVQAERIEQLQRERDAVLAAADAKKKVVTVADPCPRGGQYPVSVIGMSIRLVLDAACSLRSSAAVIAAFVARGLIDWSVPAASTIRSWLLRLGHYALTRPLDRTQPWFWLIDHTVQVGSQKLLVILGGVLSQVPFGARPLALNDLHLVALVPMAHSNGDAVERQLEVAALRTGTPRLIVSDQGSDLVKGAHDYSDLRPSMAHVPDVAHFGANLLQRRWENQPEWSSFIQKFQETATKLRPSAQAEWMGPRLRPKGRFMNLAVQLRFVRMVLGHLDKPEPPAAAVAHYGWLREYRTTVTAWLAEHELVRQTIRHLRLHGLHAGTQVELNQLWKRLAIRGQDGLRALAKSWCGYVQRYRPRDPAVRYVASTEVLESSFGKLKRVSRQQSDSGLTALALTLGTMVGSPSDAEIVAGLDATPQKKVDGWIKSSLGQSLQWLRRQLLNATPR